MKKRLTELQRRIAEILKTELPSHMKEGEAVTVFISVSQLHGKERVEFPLVIDIMQFGDRDRNRQLEPVTINTRKGNS